MAANVTERLARLEASIPRGRPTTPADGIAWADILSCHEKEWFRQLRERYPVELVSHRTFLEALTEEELDFVEVVTVRLERWKEEHPAST